MAGCSSSRLRQPSFHGEVLPELTFEPLRLVLVIIRLRPRNNRCLPEQLQITQRPRVTLTATTMSPLRGTARIYDCAVEWIRNAGRVSRPLTCDSLVRWVRYRHTPSALQPKLADSAADLPIGPTTLHGTLPSGPRGLKPSLDLDAHLVDLACTTRLTGLLFSVYEGRQCSTDSCSFRTFILGRSGTERSLFTRTSAGCYSRMPPSLPRGVARLTS